MSESPSNQRSKRQKLDKTGRFAALERLRELKGSKHKYEVSEEIDNVYDTVDEKEYSKRVLARADDDWIEDDGTGYVEDGREIFDDEDDNLEKQNKSNKKTNKGGSKKRLRDINTPTEGKSSIKSLFGSVAPKKKEMTVKLEQDDILADILGEMDTKPKLNSIRPSPIASNRISINDKSKDKDNADLAKEYMQNFTRNIRKQTEEKKNSKISDDEMLNRVLKVNTDSEKKSSTDFVFHSDTISEDINTKPNNVITDTSKDLNPDDNTLHTVHENQIKKEDTPVIIPNVKSTSNNPDIDNNDHFDDIDMDFSILDDDVNQFESNTTNSAKEIPKKIDIKETVNYENVLLNWEKCNVENEEDELMNVTIDKTQFENGSEMKIWFWDAWEDPYKRPGQIFLFGKVEYKPKEFKSVCVHIENIERCLYLLPRVNTLDTNNAVTLLDVYKDFSESVSNVLGLDSFRSKKVTKNFAFSVPNVEVPSSCEYLEVRYDGKKPPPNTKKTYNTIAHIFGANTNSLETFLMECKIKGPCWLTIKNFTIKNNPLSWCKIEVVCPNSSFIIVSEEKSQAPPPLSVVTLNVRTAINTKTTKNEVIMIAVLVNNNFAIDKAPPNPPFQRHFCGFTRPIGQNWALDLTPKLAQYKATKTIKHDSERALLNWFLTTLRNIDPDLIVTHDASDCQLDVLCDRIVSIKIPMWSRIGRLNMSIPVGKKFKDYFIGRMICDVKQSAEELIKARSYDLDTLCNNVLKIKEGERIDITHDELYSLYESGEGIMKLITLTMQDCSFIMKLMCELNVLPLALQITNICGNLMARTLQGGRSERNEFLLLHAFTEKNYIVPDRKVKETNWEQSETAEIAPVAGRKKAQYSGGLVLDPIKGLYEKYVLLMDFNSLYPSIIQEYNICFTTIVEPNHEDDVPLLPDASVEQGVLPRQIRRLVESRKEVKKLMANPDLEADLKLQYNIRQLALKLTANSMYGCLGFSYSRFFAQHLAALVTLKGREILMNTKSLVQKLNFEVIYGDTDSIMINSNCTDYEQVYKIGHIIKQAVNKIYRQVELDIDGVFKCLLLLKKKKYAAVIITKAKNGEFMYNQEHKGLDIVRRDWSQISVMAGKLILDELLSDIQIDERVANIHIHLEKFRDNINDDAVPLPLLAVTKQLTKSPKEYVNLSNMPHVQVALRMNSTRNKRYKKGDMVSYIICEDGTDNGYMQRAYHLDELKSLENLKVDKMYYLSHQIHPVVSRLCDPIEGTDASRIASCLGLDPSKFKVAAIRSQNERTEDSLGESIVKSAVQKYRYCTKFTFKCIQCKTPNLVALPYKRHETNLIPVLEKCANLECTLPPYRYVNAIRNELSLAIRSCIRRFYDNWMVCDEPNCNSNTRIYTQVMLNNRPVCMACNQGVLIRQYSESDLYNQLSYFQYIFDVTKHEQAHAKMQPEMETAYNLLKEIVDQVVSRSAYCIVKLSALFRQLPAAYNNKTKDVA